MYLRESKTGPRIVWTSTPSRGVLAELQRTSCWIFPSPRVDGPISKTAVENFWMRVRSYAELKDVRLHNLCHAYASLAIMLGETVPVVGRLHGHNVTATTLKCTHLSETAVHDAANAMGIVLGGPGT